MRMRESDAARKVLCTKPGGNEDRRRGRPKVRRSDELGKDVVRAGCRTWGGLMCRQGRGGGTTLRRSVPTQGCSANVRRGRKEEEEEEEEGEERRRRRKKKKKEGRRRRRRRKKKEE